MFTLINMPNVTSVYALEPFENARVTTLRALVILFLILLL